MRQFVRALGLFKVWSMPEWRVAFGSILISFSPVFVKIIHASPAVTGFYRMFFGFLLTSMLLLVSKRFRIKRLDHPDAASNGSKFALFLVTLAGVFFALDMVFWNKSIVLIGPGLSTLLINLQVFMLTMMGIAFFGERMNKRFFYAVPIVAIGMHLLVGIHWWQSGQSFHWGVGFGLIAMLFYSLYLLMLRQSQHLVIRIPLLHSMVYVSLIASIVIGLMVYWQGQSLKLTSWHDGEYLFFYGLCSQTIGWLLIAQGLPKIRLSLAGFLLLLQPTFSFIWDILWFHHHLSRCELAGCSLTLFAIFLAITAKRAASDDRDVLPVQTTNNIIAKSATPRMLSHHE